MHILMSGLETITTNIINAGNFTMTGKISLPRPSQGASQASQVVMTVKQNGTTILTTTAGADGFSIPLLAAAGDVISTTMTSTLAEDEVLNAVNCVITIG